ncbi:hypothetical protein [Brumimicrobium mesophilum]|uniref:hypothetical protein n=1 Tax=Brumimicrobium mesophilum TaxID=392717 RepID=UPI000D142A50|nr:hypothetical protein [Brumimicrobium mesophilum]
MKYIITTVILFSLSQFVDSQIKRILVLDSLTLAPISQVLILSQKDTLLSSSKGEIIIKNYSSDLISLFHFNYFPKFIQYDSKIDTVFMQRKPQEIEEMIIKPYSSYELFDIGYFNIRNKSKSKSALINSSILTVFIPYHSQNTFVGEILLELKRKQHAENYGVYLYEPDSMGLPSKILYHRKISVDSLKKEGVIKVGGQNIRVPENGIFIGLESFSAIDELDSMNNEGINFNSTARIEKSKSYIFITKNDKIKLDKIWHPFESVFGSDITPCFGLRVYQKK